MKAYSCRMYLVSLWTMLVKEVVQYLICCSLGNAMYDTHLAMDTFVS